MGLSLFKKNSKSETQNGWVVVHIVCQGRVGRGEIMMTNALKELLKIKDGGHVSLRKHVKKNEKEDEGVLLVDGSLARIKRAKENKKENGKVLVARITKEREEGLVAIIGDYLIRMSEEMANDLGLEEIKQRERYQSVSLIDGGRSFGEGGELKFLNVYNNSSESEAIALTHTLMERIKVKKGQQVRLRNDVTKKTTFAKVGTPKESFESNSICLGKEVVAALELKKVEHPKRYQEVDIKP